MGRGLPKTSRVCNLSLKVDEHNYMTKPWIMSNCLVSVSQTKQAMGGGLPKTSRLSLLNCSFLQFMHHLECKIFQSLSPVTHDWLHLEFFYSWIFLCSQLKLWEYWIENCTEKYLVTIDHLTMIYRQFLEYKTVLPEHLILLASAKL